MFRTTVLTLISSLVLVAIAGAATTPEQKCQAAKLDALRRRTFCIEGERRKEVLGGTTDAAKCETKFATAITKADAAAASKGSSCRWLDNADGTATDLNSGLQWELKTDDGSTRDKDNTYTWNAIIDGTAPDGTATSGCFSGHCDWRLPSIEELSSILDFTVPDCGLVACTTIPGFTSTSFYWSSTTNSPDHAWGIYFGGFGLADDNKGFENYARAVRGAR